MMTPQAEAPLSRRKRWTATVILSASLLVITMDMTILSLALPAMAADLDPSGQQQLWIVDVYSLVLAGLLIPAAAIADRLGRRRMLFVGYVVFAFASVLVLIAPTASSVIAIRAFLGLGGSFIMPATLSLIRVIFTDPKERAAALGVWAAVSGLGAAVGPLVGGLLLQHFSWHSAFLFNVPLMVIAIIAGWLVIPESRVPNPGPLDVIAALQALAGMSGLVWAIKQFGQESTFAVPGAWVALGVSAALLVWFVVRCHRSAHPLLDMSLFRSGTFSAGVVAALGTSFALIAALVLTAQWLQVVYGATPVRAGLLLIPMAVAAAVGSLIAPWVARFASKRLVLAVGLAIAGVGLVLVGLPGGRLTLGVILTAVTVVGLGIGALAVGSDMIMSGSPEDKAGNAGALEETAYELGGTLGVTVLGSISAMIYRSEVQSSEVYDVIHQTAPELAESAQESLGAAAAIADQLHLPALLQSAARAFDHSLEATGLAGGAVLFVVAAIAYFLARPRRRAVRA